MSPRMKRKLEEWVRYKRDIDKACETGDYISDDAAAASVFAAESRAQGFEPPPARQLIGEVKAARLAVTARARRGVRARRGCVAPTVVRGRGEARPSRRSRKVRSTSGCSSGDDASGSDPEPGRTLVMGAAV